MTLWTRQFILIDFILFWYYCMVKFISSLSRTLPVTVNLPHWMGQRPRDLINSNGVKQGSCLGPLLIIYLFIYLALPTKRRITTTAYANYCGSFNLTHPVNVTCGRKPEYPEETHDFRQSVDLTLFTWGLGSSRIEKVLTEAWTCDLRGERQVRNFVCKQTVWYTRWVNL
jgi:hypothetical protein